MLVGGVEMLARGLEPTDKPFIAATWVRSYRELQKHFRRVFRAVPMENDLAMGDLATVHPDVFEKEHKKVVDRLLERGRFVILASPAVPRTIFGWACADLLTLHYVYVIPELRGRGIARELCEMLGLWGDTVECSHRPTHPNARFIWNPYTIGVCP